MNKGHEKNKEGDFKAAAKYYTKAIELDSLYAEAYFSRGVVKLNNLEFDEAILDFNKALTIEPFHERSLTNRAIARIRKHELGGNRKVLYNQGVSVLIGKSNSDDTIPEDQRELICKDLKQAFFLGDKGELVKEAVSRFCQPGRNP